jgi:DNA-binding transcriptional MerR regulator
MCLADRIRLGGWSVAQRIAIGELAREARVTLRALRYYQSKGLLAPQRDGNVRVFGSEDCARLELILQGKRLGFTLWEIRDMLNTGARGSATILPVSRKKCIEQINLLERRRRDVVGALAELRQIYTGMFRDATAAADDPASPRA